MECEICGHEEAHFVGNEFLCLECEGVIEETLGELNEMEDDVNPTDEFWAQVLSDELEEWSP